MSLRLSLAWAFAVLLALVLPVAVPYALLGGALLVSVPFALLALRASLASRVRTAA
jgi:hypothetical protein